MLWCLFASIKSKISLTNCTRFLDNFSLCISNNLKLDVVLLWGRLHAQTDQTDQLKKCPNWSIKKIQTEVCDGSAKLEYPLRQAFSMVYFCQQVQYRCRHSYPRIVGWDTKKANQNFQFLILYQMRPWSIVKVIWESSFICFRVFLVLGQFWKTGPKYPKTWTGLRRRQSRIFNYLGNVQPLCKAQFDVFRPSSPFTTVCNNHFRRPFYRYLTNLRKRHNKIRHISSSKDQKFR